MYRNHIAEVRTRPHHRLLNFVNQCSITRQILKLREGIVDKRIVGQPESIMLGCEILNAIRIIIHCCMGIYAFARDCETV